MRNILTVLLSLAVVPVAALGGGCVCSQRPEIASVQARETGAIDHLLIFDPAGKLEVRVFGCILDEYTVKLTDHYPNYLDIKL